MNSYNYILLHLMYKNRFNQPISEFIYCLMNNAWNEKRNSKIKSLKFNNTIVNTFKFLFHFNNVKQVFIYSYFSISLIHFSVQIGYAFRNVLLKLYTILNSNTEEKIFRNRT